MIKKVTVVNCYGESAEIVLANDAPEHGFVIKGIDGLGPAKANINTGTLATLDGTFYNSSRLDSRNIVLDIVFTDADTIEEARLNAYKYFPIKQFVDLMIETDNREVVTRGYIESNEPEIFSDQEVTKISIICPDPLFYNSEEDQTVFNIGSSSSTNSITSFTIENEGDVEIGFDMVLKATMSSSNGPGIIHIQNNTTAQSVYIDPTYIYSVVDTIWSTNDLIELSTKKAEKHIKFHKANASAGSYVNVLNSLGHNPTWIQLKKGTNNLSITVERAFTMQCTINYTITYEGV